MRDAKYFWAGFKAISPIMTGVLPFGAVMGTVSANAGLTLFQSTAMNFLAFAGAAQLAAVDLMTHNAPVVVIVATGLIINLRFMLYSAAFSPIVQPSGFWTKLSAAYLLTDQSYAVMTAHQERLPSRTATLSFYFGSCFCMALCWHLSVVVGFLFGNFAPPDISLDYAVPLSFIALVMPTLKNRKYVMVAVFSSVAAVIFRPLPFNLGLIVTAVLAIGVAVLLIRPRVSP